MAIALPLPYFLLCVLIILDFSSHGLEGRFGETLSDRTEDDLFGNMGRAVVQTFRVVDGFTELDISVENVAGTDELWVLDFQPFKYSTSTPVIDEYNGHLLSSSTGSCSNIYQDATMADDYFGDDFFQNFTGTGNKLLFNLYTRGNYDLNETFRSDNVMFVGNISTFFECERVDGSRVWDMQINDEEIEANTVMYVSNVRPALTLDGYSAFNAVPVAYVQSHISLIWRLARFVILKAVISSAVELQVEFDFAIVEPVLLADGSPDPSRTYLIFGISTISPVEENQMNVYKEDSVAFVSDNPANRLTQTIESPSSDPSSSPVCQIVKDGFCKQSWEFKFELEVDMSTMTSGQPIGAAGSFQFDYYANECENITTNTGCVQVDETPRSVETALTLQTVIQAIDEATDSITVTIVRLVNQRGEDLREGTGAKHRENITLEVNFSPAFLRDKYVLQLQLFLVCRGEHLLYSTRGCLGASTEDRYTAFLDDELSFKYDPNEDPMYGITEEEIESGDYLSGSPQQQPQRPVTLVPSPESQTSELPSPGALWPMNGVFKVDDVTPGRNHGQASSTAVLVYDAAGHPDGVYRFRNKPHSFVEFPNDGAYDVDQRSMTLLVKVFPLGTRGPVVQFNRNGDGVRLWQTAASDFAVVLVRRDLQRQAEVAAANALVQSAWNYIGFTYDSATGMVRLFRDGAVVASDNVGVMPLATQFEVRVGAVDGNNRYFHGMVTCLQVYSRLLSSEEIQQAETRCERSLGLTNIARGKNAEQSSDYLQSGPNVVASSAVDGNTNSNFDISLSCTHTEFEFESWWRVDLADDYVVNHVVLTNRGDCCGERLLGAVVRVGPSPTILENDVCGQVTSTEPVSGFDCRSLLGRYASVQLEQQTNYLTLCEVEVYTDLYAVQFTDGLISLTKTQTIWRGALNDGVLITSDGSSHSATSYAMETAWLETDHVTDLYYIVQKMSSQVSFVASAAQYGDLFAGSSAYVVQDTFYASAASFSSSPSSRRFYSAFSLTNGISYVGTDSPSSIDCGVLESGFTQNVEIPSHNFPLTELGVGFLMDLKDLDRELRLLVAEAQSFGMNPSSLPVLLEMSITSQGRLDTDLISDQLMQQLQFSEAQLADFITALQIIDQIFHSNQWSAGFLIDLLVLSTQADMTVDAEIFQRFLYGLMVFKLPAVSEEFQLGGLLDAYDYMAARVGNGSQTDPDTKSLNDIYSDAFADGRITSLDLVNTIEEMITLINMLPASGSISDSESTSSDLSPSTSISSEFLEELFASLMPDLVDETFYSFLFGVTLYNSNTLDNIEYHLRSGEIDYDGQFFLVYRQECTVLGFQHQLEFYTYSAPYGVQKTLDKNGFDEWTTWSECSKSCSNGVRSKSRTCWRMDGSCPGNEVVVMACNTQDCSQFTDTDGQILQYEFVEEGRNHDGAKSYCVGRGGRLARIKSEEAHQYIQKQIQSRPNPSSIYFLDMTDTEHEGIFKYSNGEVIQYATWISYNPDDYDGDEDCVTLWGNEDYKFNDYPCHHVVPFICEYDFLLVFKVFAGTQQNTFNLWTSSVSVNEHDETAKELDITQGTPKNYKSSLVQKWSTLWIEEVRFVLYSAGQEVLRLVFDGLLSDKVSWFTEDRLMESPYSDIATSYKNYFSIPGHYALDGVERRFFISQNYYGCPDDLGYLAVVEATAARHVCNWEQASASSYPLFLYSTGDSYMKWSDASIGQADTMAIFIKMKDMDVLELLPEVEYTAKHIPKPTTDTELNTQTYDTEQKLHIVEFTNNALSGERMNYVMTTVYTMVEVEEPTTRRRRDARRHKRSILTSTAITYKEFQKTMEVVAKARRSARQRRNLQASTKLPQMKSGVFGYLGCPDKSVYVPYFFQCQCIVAGEYYDSDLFQCTNGTYTFDNDISTDAINIEVPEIEVKSSGLSISYVRKPWLIVLISVLLSVFHIIVFYS